MNRFCLKVCVSGELQRIPIILTLKGILYSFSEICFSDVQITSALDLVFVGNGGEKAHEDQEDLFKPRVCLTQSHSA